MALKQNKPILRILLLMQIWLIPAWGLAQDSTLAPPQDLQSIYESTKPEGSRIDMEQLEREAKNYRYDEKEPEKKEKKENTLKKKPIEKKSPRSFWVGDTGRNIVYLVAIIALVTLIVVLIYHFSKNKMQLKKQMQIVQPGDAITEESLSALPVDELLSQAMEEKDYRLAIRLLYLRSLKMLMEKGWIHPSPEKTNFDYVRELRNHPAEPEFKFTTGIFEKIWYGEFIPDANNFQVMRRQFSDFHARLRQGK